MIVNPGIRRFLGSAIQRLFNSASFYAPLTHSLVPERGTGSPTFTRATTATGQKWDEAGYLDFTALAGEIVFKGARRERNYFTDTEALTNASWFVVGAIVAAPTRTGSQVDPNGGTTAIKLDFPQVVGANAYSMLYQSVGSSGMSSKTACHSVYLKGAAGGEQLYISSTGNGIAYERTLVTLTTSWVRYQLTGATTSTATQYFQLGVDLRDASQSTKAAQSIYVAFPQLEDVTGQTTQTASEYVSVGVESAPAYHGSMVDGVKCFNTDRSGNPISTSGSYPLVGYVPWEARTNLCLQSETFDTTWVAAGGAITVGGSVVAPNGATVTKSKISENSTSTVAFGVAQNLTKAASALAYSFSGYFKQAERTWIQVVLWDNVSVGTRFWYNLATGSVGSTAAIGAGFTAVSIQIAPAANGFYRCIANVTTNTGTTLRTEIQTASGDGASGVTGVVGNGIYAWGAQVELGSFATPYIPTTTVAVARNAPVDQYPTTAGPIAAAGSIALDFTPYHAPSGTIALWGTYVDASNYTAILHDATNLIFRKRIAGSNYDATIANAFVSGTTYKVAATWGAAGTAIYLDGVAGTPHANTTAAQIAATMQVGADGNSLQQPGAGTTNLRIWQRQLSSPEGVAVTA